VAGALVADRHGLALLPDGRLAAVELLRCVAEGSGCCGRAATGWSDQPAQRLEPDRRGATAGLTFAAWCQWVP
jgi:hypothetical protein